MNTSARQKSGGAERCAAVILQAWRGADRERLQAALASAAGMAPAGDSEERERTELLAAIAADWQDRLMSGRAEGSRANLQLLRHLAGPRPMAFYIN